MAKSLSELRKQSASVLTKLKQKSEDSSSASYKDERIWTPTYDKAKGAGYCRVRFMPAPQGEEFPFVTVYSHNFKGATGKYYIENSLSTIKKPDPVGNMNRSLWNSGIESDKDVARLYKRKTNYYANVLIIDDPMNPDNNGKVMIYRYGPMIHKLLEEKMFPQFDTDEPLNPFDPWTGADFEIRITSKQFNGAQVPNYEKSFFHKPKSMGDDDEIEALWAKCHSLQEFLTEKNFKTFEELQRRLVDVLGHSVGSGISVTGGDVEVPRETKAAAPKAKAAPVAKAVVEDDDLPFEPTPAPKAKAAPAKASKVDDADDDDLSFFASL